MELAEAQGKQLYDETPTDEVYDEKARKVARYTSPLCLCKLPLIRELSNEVRLRKRLRRSRYNIESDAGRYLLFSGYAATSLPQSATLTAPSSEGANVYCH